jgi:hypothetical protein
MGISLKGKGWHCWLNHSHAGRSRTRLIQLLLRCDDETAKRLAGNDDAVTIPDGGQISARVHAKLTGQPIERQSLKLMPYFKSLEGFGISAGPFREYIKGRGYTSGGIKWLVENYDLRYCTQGPFAARVIIPVRDQWGRLLTWTGRAIRPDVSLRYRALGLAPTQSLPPAVCHPQQTLLGLRQLWTAPNPAALIVTEGPFDAMWLTLWGQAMGVYATCLFGLNMTEAQMVLLSALEARFSRTFMLLDRSARKEAFRLANSGLELPIKRLERGKDPAELSPPEAQALALSCLP